MPTKLTPEILTAAITGFEEQKKRLDARIAELRQQLNGSPTSTYGAAHQPTKRRTMSAAVRRRIAAAQRKRSAESRMESLGAAKPTQAPVKKKRRLSAAGKRAIIEATKRRRAAVRTAAKKSARG